MFKIISVKKTAKKDKDYFLIEVHFSHDGEHNKDFHFGFLDEYHKALVMLDKEKYESFFDSPEDDGMVIESTGEGEDKISRIVFKKPGPRELGYCKTMDCAGTNSIQHLGKGEYKYTQYISKNYITEAAVKQLLEMKDHIDRGYCRYGDYPDQVGAFRSGDALHDFIGVLETLDRFWD